MCLNFGNKPPLTVFFASIVGFVLALGFVSLYLQSHRAEILNPDITDWNNFYSTLSDMEICFGNGTATPKPAMTHLDTGTTPAPATSENHTEEANVTYSILADVQIIADGKNLEDQVYHGFIGGHYLGFKRDPNVLEVTIELSKEKNRTSCVTFSGPSHLLPNSPHLPEKCVASSNAKVINISMAQPWMANDWCSGGKVASLTVAPQNELNVYLSEGDVTLIQIHILYTTCLLCVMMVVLLFYTLFTKRYVIKPKSIPASDQVPLHP